MSWMDRDGDIPWYNVSGEEEEEEEGDICEIIYRPYESIVNIIQGKSLHCGANGCLNNFWNNHLEAKIL